MAADYIEANDGAPDCRTCDDTGSVNGHPCNHRDNGRRESSAAAVVGRHVAKNWDYATGRSV